MDSGSPDPKWVDYSGELKPLSSKGLRLLVQVAGTVFFVTGIVGIFVPLLPTTPFLLLAAACYVRTSARSYNWLMNHRMLGPYIRDWRSHRGIPLRAKVVALVMMTVTFGVSSIFISRLPIRIAFFSIGIGVAVYVLRQPTRRS